MPWRSSSAVQPASCAMAMAAMPFSILMGMGCPSSTFLMLSMGEMKSKVMSPFSMRMFSAWKSPSSRL